MQVLIPAAGKGTRLRPHTLVLPKSLLPLAGKTLIDHILEPLLSLPIERYIIVIGYRGEQIQQHITTTYPDYPIHFVEQSQQYGLGHSIWTARSTILQNTPLLIVLGDTIVDVQWEIFASSSSSLIGVHPVEHPQRFGVVELDATGNITQLIEKPEHPPSNLAIVGLYYLTNPTLLLNCLEELITKDIRTRGEYQLTDALQLMVNRGEQLRPLQLNHWYDCGNFETWLMTNRILLQKHQPESPLLSSTTTIIPPVSIAESATVERSTVGPYVTVGDHAHIVDSILQDAIIGKGTTIRNTNLAHSVIGDHCSVLHYQGSLNIGAYSAIDGSVQPEER